MKRILLILIVAPISVFAQIGGSSIYEFVTLPYSAVENAMGGNGITRNEKNLAFSLKNPSLLDSTYNKEVVGNWGLLHMKQTGIGLGTIGYAHTLFPKLSLQAGIHFINYGVFEGYDEEGVSTTNFVPSEYQLIAGASYQVRDHISVGANLKPVLSYMEQYSSYGLLFDVAVSYRLERTCLSLAARNVGWQIKPYTTGNRESIPYSVDFGISQRLEHAPLRFNIVYEDLQHFDVSVAENKQQTTLNSIYEDDEEREFVVFGKTFLKHISLSTEIFIGKNITLIGGYNYRKSEDLSFGSSKHGAGVSIGLVLTFSRFNVAYGWSKQQAAGGRSFFTLGFNTETIYSMCKKEKRKKSDI